MSSIREEIKKLQAPAEAHAPTYVKALASVLAVIDAHEAKPESLRAAAEIAAKAIGDAVGNGQREKYVDIMEIGLRAIGYAKPSDERPARERMRAWAADNRNGDEAPMVLAIVEAIDALTAAIKEAKHG